VVTGAADAGRASLAGLRVPVAALWPVGDAAAEGAAADVAPVIGGGAAEVALVEPAIAALSVVVEDTVVAAAAVPLDWLAKLLTVAAGMAEPDMAELKTVFAPCAETPWGATGIGDVDKVVDEASKAALIAAGVATLFSPAGLTTAGVALGKAIGSGATSVVELKSVWSARVAEGALPDIDGAGWTVLEAASIPGARLVAPLLAPLAAPVANTAAAFAEAEDATVVAVGAIMLLAAA
jgi:hypothetical protein